MSYYPPTDWELRDFYREHVDALYRSCSFLTCGEADAQAMVQEIFLKLLNKGMIFSSDKDAKAWMLLTAYKMSRKPPKPPLEAAQAPKMPESSEAGEPVADTEEKASLSEQTAQEETAAMEERTTQGENEEEPAKEETPKEEAPPAKEEPPKEDPSATEEETADRDEEPAVSNSGVFPAELQKLSRKDRLIALLYYCEGYRKTEIADLLGAPTFTVGRRLKRIKKRILQETGGDEAC